MAAVLGGVGGSLLTLTDRAVRTRWRDVQTAQALAVALWEELQAVEFSIRGGDVVFAGFGSQVFDSLFSDIAHSFPEGLSRKVMRYHWRMKYLQQTAGGGWSSGSNRYGKHAANMRICRTS